MTPTCVSVLGNSSKIPLKTHAKGEIIIFQGEAPGRLMLLNLVRSRLTISVSLGTKSPSDFMVRLMPSGMWIYDQTPSSIYYYEVFSDEVTLRVVPKNDY